MDQNTMPGMTDGMPPEPEGDEMSNGEICVPLSSLATPDDEDQMQQPAQGDKGQANVEYTVSRVEGDNAYITLDAVNGNKVGATPSPDATEEAGLRADIGNLPEGY